MSGIRHDVMRLLLLLLLPSFILTGFNSEDGLDIPYFNIRHSCQEDSVCFYIWQSTIRESSPYVAIVSNGKIQRERGEDLGCTLPVRFIPDDIRRLQCQQEQVSSASPVLRLMPGKKVSLQCVVIPQDGQEHCNTQLSLTWVDEAGAEIQKDSKHQIEWKSACDTTLTITAESPGSMRFRCQATVGEDVQSSAELRVRVPAPKGKGRVLIPEPEPESEGETGGRNHDAISVVVVLVGCVALTAMVAAYAVNRRRTRNQPPDDSCYTESTYKITDAEDVIYTEVVLPAGSAQVHATDYESTEYACVRYNSVQNII